MEKWYLEIEEAAKTNLAVLIAQIAADGSLPGVSANALKAMTDSLKMIELHRLNCILSEMQDTVEAISESLSLIEGRFGGSR